eukprot:m.8940 g.8940  ORF g.8940 m.8940 type:complete len:193 (+) comp6248_c1_seq1:41-619(+)
MSITLDFSFSDLTQLEDVYEEDPREGKKKPEEGGKAPRHPYTALKLNNNALASFEGFPTVLNSIMWDVQSITLLDLSFNAISVLCNDFFCLPNLGVLYLHGNDISSFKEVNKLVQIENLKILSLHGNPIEKEDGYRNFVIALFPALKKFDFSGVTRKDHEAVERWKTVHAPKRMAKALKRMEKKRNEEETEK